MSLPTYHYTAIGTPKAALAYVENQVKLVHEGDTTGHDWLHVDRVRRTALAIAATEACDPFIVQVAALLHDVDDPKIAPENSQRADQILRDAGVLPKVRKAVNNAISTVSFKGGANPIPATIEGKIVQDADRLDAIGAIGVARCFAYGGAKGRPIYDPSDKPQSHYDSPEAYYASQKSSLVHFDEKLFKVRDLMNTETARQMAASRHDFLVAYYAQFMHEWYAV